MRRRLLVVGGTERGIDPGAGVRDVGDPRQRLGEQG